MKTASDFVHADTYSQQGPLVNISSYPIIRYTYTGEVVTDSNLASFKAEAAKVNEGMKRIFEEGKSNGVSGAQILEKMYSYLDSQSDDYLNIRGWVRFGSSG